MVLERKDIAVIRALFGLTRRQLAFICDVSPAYITYVEQGKKPISERLENNINARFKLNDELLMRIKMLAKEAEDLKGK